VGKNIKQSVGSGGANLDGDVRTVQQYLREQGSLLAPWQPATVTGVCDAQTVRLIEVYQRVVVKVAPTGLVEPSSPTMSELAQTSFVPAVTNTDPAQEAIQSMESTAINFAKRFIQDARVREGYIAEAKKYATELFEDLRAKRITPAEAAERANLMRNQLLDAARLKSSDIGKAVAEQIKKSGKTLAELQEYYALKLFQKAFKDLPKSEQNRVFLKIVGASARPNKGVTAMARNFGKVGRGLIVVALAVSVYNVVTADDPGREVAREAVGFGAGFAGSVAGGALAGLACGPGAPACVAIGAFIGGVVFAIGADLSFDELTK
jgi:hypothetical protein